MREQRLWLSLLTAGTLCGVAAGSIPTYAVLRVVSFLPTKADEGP